MKLIRQDWFSLFLNFSQLIYSCESYLQISSWKNLSQFQWKNLYISEFESCRVHKHLLSETFRDLFRLPLRIVRKSLENVKDIPWLFLFNQNNRFMNFYKILKRKKKWKLFEKFFSFFFCLKKYFRKNLSEIFFLRKAWKTEEIRRKLENQEGPSESVKFRTLFFFF